MDSKFLTIGLPSGSLMEPTIALFAKAGYSVAQINAQYPGITERDIEAALKYEDVA